MTARVNALHRSGLHPLAPYDASRYDDRMRRYDTGYEEEVTLGDGTVTAEEFKRPYAGMVRHMDRNDDGAIDRGDMRRPDRGPGPGPGPGRAPN